MTAKRQLVLDANILIRAVLGSRVRNLIASNTNVTLLTPEVCFADARKYLPDLLTKHGIDSAPALVVLNSLRVFVASVAEEFYASEKSVSIARIGGRDPNDWPILALALALDCPIWTEDRDFFGTGIPTWTTDRVELYLNAKGNNGLQ